MARVKHSGGEASLRAYLLAEALWLRDAYIDKLPEAEPVFSGPVDALARGKACSLRRYELPDDYPARLVGHQHDILILTETNQLSAARSPRSFRI